MSIYNYTKNLSIFHLILYGVKSTPRRPHTLWKKSNHGACSWSSKHVFVRLILLRRQLNLMYGWIHWCTQVDSLARAPLDNVLAWSIVVYPQHAWYLMYIVYIMGQILHTYIPWTNTSYFPLHWSMFKYRQLQMSLERVAYLFRKIKYLSSCQWCIWATSNDMNVYGFF